MKFTSSQLLAIFLYIYICYVYLNYCLTISWQYMYLKGFQCCIDCSYHFLIGAPVRERKNSRHINETWTREKSALRKLQGENCLWILQPCTLVFFLNMLYSTPLYFPFLVQFLTLPVSASYVVDVESGPELSWLFSLWPGRFLLSSFSIPLCCFIAFLNQEKTWPHFIETDLGNLIPTFNQYYYRRL